MKIVHLLRECAHGNLSYADLASGGRGVTGSEQTMLYISMAQANMGHEVVCYMPTDTPGVQAGVEVIDIRATWPRMRKLDNADVAISWVSSDLLRDLPPNKLRMCNVQINDWWPNGFGYEKWVDSYIYVSYAHKKHLLSQVGNPGENSSADIIPNGTDYLLFSNRGYRVPKRCAYLSSPDRGLHWLLYAWPAILQMHPDAELHIYYEVQKWVENAVLLNSEVGVRARYVIDRLNATMPRVVLHGAVAPKQLAADLASCDLMLYPADTVRWTEGFSCSTMNACAAGAVPIITDCDALGEVYENSGVVIIPRGDSREWLDRYVANVVGMMSNPSVTEHLRGKVQAFAKRYDWNEVAKIWEEVIARRFREKIAAKPTRPSRPTAGVGDPPPEGGTGPLCEVCGESTWVELGGAESDRAYHPNIDVREIAGVDIVLDIGKDPLPFHDNHADRIKMIQSLNHLSYVGAKHALGEALRILKPGQGLFVLVTDFEYFVSQISTRGLTESDLESIYGTRGDTYDEDLHRWGYSFEYLKSLMEAVGFTNITHYGYYNRWEMKVMGYKLGGPSAPSA